MSKTKKNTLAYWYEEIQNIPNLLKINFEMESLKAIEIMKNLKVELRKAKLLKQKIKGFQLAALRKARGKHSKVSKAVLNQFQNSYQDAENQVALINKEINHAKSALTFAKFKQKYFDILESTIGTISNIFTKKHNTAVKKKNVAKGKKRYMATKAHVRRPRKHTYARQRVSY